MNFTTQTVGSNRAIDSNPNAAGTTGPITLTTGQTDLTIDAGLVKAPCTAKLGDYVFCDANKNGIHDSGEGGISGVTVKLLNGSGTSVLATTTTNSAGNYQFSGLAAGTYMVQFVTPSSYTLSPALQGSNTAKDSNPNTSTGKTGVITLAAGQTDLTIDAGMYKSSSGGSNGCGGWGGYGGDCVSQHDFSCGVNGYGGYGGSGCQSPCFVQGGGYGDGGCDYNYYGGGGYNGCDTSRDLTNCGGYGGYGGSYGDCRDNSSGRQDNSWCNYGGSQNASYCQPSGNQWSGGYSGSDNHYGSGGYCSYN
jgi:hypothetical protein